MKNRRFSMPFRWSRRVRGVTIVCGVTSLGAVLYLLWWLDGTMPTLLWVRLAVALVIVGSAVGAAGYMPIRLLADGEKITIRRLFGALRIPLGEITEVRPIPKAYLDGSFRTFGSGGFFGYLGRFRNKRLGNYTMYATDLNRLVRVDTDRRRYVFSCERPEEFAEFVRERLRKKE
ncbi:PH domain-containing protein [Rikenella microfusus]|uniref:PH domain-containing protein n=1 Tax=Rikenella microfusus TaxID=28139 RepID=UPI00248E1615|nr:PH domain-containing protein [Rikenella microfusus]